ncbi:hypothetical protein SAMN05421780_10415 [Flexibacter flexilis DSM 6793]|uniref:Uncharacterized protein n=1 Tax=Flexibacter flexilis DSM 6793 TaxID=927664 RepID=A0A1I1HTY6_9BACT|nr:hypothetical protein [Flexibacter flexilis]SFC24913.1 hypothetical protein SAMN05421780_10415 [Flexibacter flexilis DSM 6793]
MSQELIQSVGQLSLENKTFGTPAIVDDAFVQTLNKSKNGGDDTWQFFYGIAQTSDFWGKVANNSIDFADGVDKNGNPIIMASDGNIALRIVGLFSVPENTDDDNPVIGVATVQTGNTTTSASMIMAFTVRVASLPVYIPLTKSLLADFVKPVYSNLKTFLQKMSSSLSESTSVGNVVDAAATTEEVVAEQNSVEEIVENEALEYIKLNWSDIMLEAAGVGSLMALSMALTSLGHQMYHSLYIQNLTSEDITWSYDIITGKVSLFPGEANTTIPAQITTSAIPDVQDSTVLSYQANFQFINSNDYDSLAYVMSLKLPSQDVPVKILIYIPWQGSNIIWAGVTNDNSQTVFNKYATSPQTLSFVVDVYDYQLTLSLNAISGKTIDNNYFYCSTAILEPKH